MQEAAGRAIGSRDRSSRRLLIAFLIVAAALLLFGKLASEVLEGDGLTLDRQLLLALRNPQDPSVPIGPRWLAIAMVDVTALGGVTVLMLLTAIVGGYLLMQRKYATAAVLAGAVLSGTLLENLLKYSFHRARPDIVAHLVDVHTTSFPSGHATKSAIVYLTLGALLARASASRRERAYVLAIAMLLTVGIGASRVFLGVHWPSDVLAGWIVGSAWALLCWTLAGWLQRRRTIEPPGGTEASPGEQ